MSMTSTIHVCPVFREVTPIITPALDPTFRMSRVVLLSSHHISDQVTDIEQSLASLTIGVDVHQLTDEWLPIELEAILDNIIKKHPSSEVMLNVSSGTTPMCIRAAQHFIKLNLPVYYVNPENDHLCWIHPTDRRSFELQERLDLKHYLIAHGIDKISIAAELEAVTSKNYIDASCRIAEIAHLNPTALSQLNRLAAIATPDGTSYSALYKISSHVRKYDVDRLMNIFTRHSLARIDDKKIIFLSYDAKEFVKGGWLEVYTRSQVERLKKLNPMIRDIQRGITIRKVVLGEELTNEIDVAVLADNRLYMIECKTGGVALDIGDVIVNLEALRSFLNDDRAGAMVVSVKDATSMVRKRADDYNIKLCTGKRVPDIFNILRSWIVKGHD